MGLLFCYSVFGRRPKIGKAGPNHGSQTGSSLSRKIHVESRVSAVKDIPPLRAAEECNLVHPMSKGNEGSQFTMPDFVTECDSLLREQLNFEGVDAAAEKHDFPEYVVDVEKLSVHHDCQEQPYDDYAKSSDEAQVSSGSQRTLQGGVSLSVGEGTVSSDNQRPGVPHEEVALVGGSLGAHEDTYSDYSSGGGVLHSAQHFRDVDSAGRAGISQELAFGIQYSDDGDAQRVAGPKIVDVAGGEDCADKGSHVCDDEERFSRHASDPGFYATEVQKMSSKKYMEGSASPQADAVDCVPFHFVVAGKLSADSSDERVSSKAPELSQGVHLDNVSLNRVKEWVDSIQFADVDFDNECLDVLGQGNTSLDNTRGENSETLAELHIVGSGGANSVSLVNAAVRSLHPFSTVAHLSGIGLREVPSLGVFSSLRVLNLSANLIAHVPVGFLPRSLHSLDLSRNKIAQIEGFRELSRLRVLNLSYNRISRIGHGLANCTLIKELYLAGNKIGEVEGLHRLLKLGVLDLSFNKVTTSKALGQLAANYGSLLALNLIGNPILTNFSEDQMRKLVTTLVPHVAYLNRQPIKAISVREAALDSVARAALGTSQRYAKARDTKPGRKTSGTLTRSAKKKLPPHQHSRASEKKVASTFVSGHHPPHGKGSIKAEGVGPRSLLGVSHATGRRSMPRSRSASVLHE